MRKIKIGIGQFGSVHLNLNASLQKLEAIMEQAAKENVELLVIGETWLSGYPAWLDHCAEVARWDYPPMKEVYKKVYDSSLSIDSKEFAFIASLAKKFNIILSIGINEKVLSGPGNGTIYNSLLLISNTGELINHHRKLMPTFTEKLIYGTGDGFGLKASDTSLGRIGGNICWEHWMPLTRQAMHDSGEHIHIAVWPTVHEMHQVACRQYAFEGRCFVIVAGQLMKASDFPSELIMPEHLKIDPSQLVLRGGSCVIAPNGNFLVTPVFDEEKLITCEIDVSEVIKERMTLDTSGHYQRRDVFDFAVNTKRVN